MNTKQLKKQLILNIPYIILGLLATNLGEAWRIAAGVNASEKVQSLVLDGVFATAFSNPLPSLYPADLLVGIACGAALRLAVYLKGKNAKKFRHNEEYGSARWGRHADIEPFEDPVFANNVILSQSERITMSSRPKIPKYARNKNVLVVGGSGSGKTRFFIKPNLLQMWEIEQSSRTTLVKIVAGRMLIIGVINLFLITVILISMAYIYQKSMTEMVLYGLIPFNISCTCYLFICAKSRTNDSLYHLIACMIFLSGTFSLVLHQRFIFEASMFWGWIGFYVLSIILLGKTLQLYLKKEKMIGELIWNLQ